MKPLFGRCYKSKMFSYLLYFYILSLLHWVRGGVACLASVSMRFRSKERIKRVKMGQAKERGGGGEERKETLADKPREFENRPLGLSCLSSRIDF